MCVGRGYVFLDRSGPNIGDFEEMIECLEAFSIELVYNIVTELSTKGLRDWTLLPH